VVPVDLFQGCLTSPFLFSFRSTDAYFSLTSAERLNKPFPTTLYVSMFDCSLFFLFVTYIYVEKSNGDEGLEESFKPPNFLRVDDRDFILLHDLQVRRVEILPKPPPSIPSDELASETAVETAAETKPEEQGFSRVVERSQDLAHNGHKAGEAQVS
jgi:hypothetical protein